MLEIGGELARVSGDGPAAIRVVGVEEGTNPRYVCQEVPFGQNASYTPEELRLLYAAVDPEIKLKTEEEAWRELSSRKVRRMNLKRIDLEAEQNALPTPEEAFAAAAEAAKKQ